MAYIATKATYIDEEEVKDDNGNVLQRRIITDVDDVVFNTVPSMIISKDVLKEVKNNCTFFVWYGKIHILYVCFGEL